MADVSKDEKVELKIVEIRDDGTAIVALPDGRVFPASVKEGLAIRKNAKVEITNEGGVDSDGGPLKATITKVV